MTVEWRGWKSGLDTKISVAPMIEWTYQHCRCLLRQFSPRVLLRTEMIVAQAILLPGADSPLHAIPVAHFAVAHGLYGLTLGILNAKAQDV